MGAYWAALARSGDPNRNGGRAAWWPELEAPSGNLSSRVLRPAGLGAAVEVGLHEADCAFWERLGEEQQQAGLPVPSARW